MFGGLAATGIARTFCRRGSVRERGFLAADAGIFRGDQPYCAYATVAVWSVEDFAFPRSAYLREPFAGLSTAPPMGPTSSSRGVKIGTSKARADAEMSDTGGQAPQGARLEKNRLMRKAARASATTSRLQAAPAKPARAFHRHAPPKFCRIWPTAFIDCAPGIFGIAERLVPHIGANRPPSRSRAAIGR